MNLWVEGDAGGHIDAPPLSMLWFVPDGCVKYWCDHGARRGYPTCHSITAFRPKQQQLWIVKGAFSYFADTFQLAELPPATESASCQSSGSLFLCLSFFLVPIFCQLRLHFLNIFCKRLSRWSRVFAPCCPACSTPPPREMKVQPPSLTLPCVLHIAQYLSINAPTALAPTSRAISAAKSWVNYVLNFLLAESSAIAAADSSVSPADHPAR